MWLEMKSNVTLSIEMMLASQQSVWWSNFPCMNKKVSCNLLKRMYWVGFDCYELLYVRNKVVLTLPTGWHHIITKLDQYTVSFQEVAADVFMQGKLLHQIDCYLDWPTIIPMNSNMTMSHLIRDLTIWFSQIAVPDVLRSDVGLQFTANKF